MTVYKLDQEHQISSSKGVATTVSERDTDKATTGGGLTSMSDSGITTSDNESQPKDKKGGTTKVCGTVTVTKEKVQAPNKKASKQAAKDAKTIQNLKNYQTKSKEKMKLLIERNKMLEEAAAPKTNAATEPEPEPEPEPKLEPTAEMPTTQP